MSEITNIHSQCSHFLSIYPKYRKNKHIYNEFQNTIIQMKRNLEKITEISPEIAIYLNSISHQFLKLNKKILFGINFPIFHNKRKYIQKMNERFIKSIQLINTPTEKELTRFQKEMIEYLSNNKHAKNTWFEMFGKERIYIRVDEFLALIEIILSRTLMPSEEEIFRIVMGNKKRIYTSMFVNWVFWFGNDVFSAAKNTLDSLYDYSTSMIVNWFTSELRHCNYDNYFSNTIGKFNIQFSNIPGYFIISIHTPTGYINQLHIRQSNGIFEIVNYDDASNEYMNKVYYGLTYDGNQYKNIGNIANRLLNSDKYVSPTSSQQDYKYKVLKEYLNTNEIMPYDRNSKQFSDDGTGEFIVNNPRKFLNACLWV